MRLPRLYPILDVACAAQFGHDVVAVAGGLAALGLDLQQLRAKALSDREFLALADRLARLAPRLVVNDRADLARMCGAWGVHVGQDDLAPRALRAAFGDALRIGCSTHNVAQIEVASAEHPDYLAIGPVFATASKRNPDPVVGLDGVRAARAAWSGPLVAIGGITIDNAASVLSAGADSVAVIAGLWAAPDPAAAAESYLRSFRAYRQDSSSAQNPS